MEAAGSVLFLTPCCVWFDFLVPFPSQNDAKVLEQPVVVQSVGTDGRVFQFLVLQLNTTQLASNEGVKNLVWVDSDQLLYQHFWCRPVIKKKVVVVSPAISSLVMGPGPGLRVLRVIQGWS